MESADWGATLIWVAVLLLAASAGWLLSLVLARWSARRTGARRGPAGSPAWVVDSPPAVDSRSAAAPARSVAATGAGPTSLPAGTPAGIPAGIVGRTPSRSPSATPARPQATARPARAAKAAAAAGADDDWPDTVLVAPGGATIESALPADDPDLSPDTDGLSARHAQGLLLLAQRRYESAWGALQEVAEEEAPALPAGRLVKPLDKLATAFEASQRYDLARDVYEHLADLAPNAPEFKPRLVRARGLAMAVQTGSLDVNRPPGADPRADARGGAPRPAALPQSIGRFVTLRELGRGAMGAVYHAHDPNRSAEIALKTLALSRDFSGPELQDARARFFREAEMAGRLEHPNIVRIFESGEADGLAYIAMELVSGEDLARYTEPGRLLPPALVLRIVARVADALAYAHSRGVTHRDIKPANVMVDLAADSVKIMDFGVARMADSTRTRTGIVLGTPSFMSPELLAGQRIDGRTDLYALGVTLFQLLTGQLPFHDASMARLMRAIANDPAPDIRTLRPELPQALADVVALALQKHPETRYANGTQMAADLRAVAAALRNPMENRAPGQPGAAG